MDDTVAGVFRDLRERCDYLITYEQQTFYQLAQLLRPEWSEADVFDITTKLAHSVNQVLQPGVTEEQLRSSANTATGENRPISLFLHLHGLKQLLSGISCTLLCNLASAIPMGDPGQRHDFLMRVQERFQLWSNSELESLKSEFDGLMPYLQHQFILSKLQDTLTPPQVCNALESLFSFSLQDVLAFKAWIESLDGASVNVVANLFQFTEDFIFKVWSLLCGPLSVPPYTALSTSNEGWSMLGTSFNTPFPPMNASDDGSSSGFGGGADWPRTKKRTAGGTSKHIINLNDSSSGVVSLRLSSSLNAFMPQTKRNAMASISPSPSTLHEMHIPHHAGHELSGHLLSPSSHQHSHHHHHYNHLPATVSGMDLGSGSANSHGTNRGLSSHHDTSAQHALTEFDQSMLHASEAPLASTDDLRSSNWTVPHPKFYDDPTGHKDGEVDMSSAAHFALMPAPPAAHQGDELRSASNGITELTISQAEAAATTGGSNLSSHNAQFFPTPPSPASHHRRFNDAPPSVRHQQSPSHLSPGAPGMVDGIAAPLIGHKQPQSHNVGYVNGVRLELRITGAPPAKSVYQRILKPYPVVKVIGADKLSNRVLFLKASLWNADGTVQMTCLDGGLQVAAQPTTATFKKLKVLNTSVQKGTLFKLKFQLEIFNEREQSLDIHVWSDPMEVVSHTVYLNNPSNTAPTPATVSEAIPNYGQSGQRVVILGSSFIDTDSVRVKFGDVIAHHSYHETGALVAVAPPQPSGTHPKVLVSVSNDGNDYSATSAAFTYI